MPITIRALFLATLVASLVGCSEQARPDVAALAVECAPPMSTYVVDATPVLYADAEARCVELGGHLVEFDSTAEIQAVFDAWVTAQYVDGSVPSSEALWVGTWITNVDGSEYGYAMLRGGALIPVLQDGDFLGLAACEITVTMPRAN